MGLDILALQKATRLDDRVKNSGRYDGHVYKTDGLDRLNGCKEGYYKAKERFSFRAGSYSGYNEWRSWLCRTFLGVSPDTVWNNEEKYKDKPFFELINFSDCEGAIGPKTSAKLAKDFKENARALVKADIPGMWFVNQYSKWQHAFEMASDDGFVIFC